MIAPTACPPKVDRDWVRPNIPRHDTARAADSAGPITPVCTLADGAHHLPEIAQGCRVLPGECGERHRARDVHAAARSRTLERDDRCVCRCAADGHLHIDRVIVVHGPCPMSATVCWPRWSCSCSRLLQSTAVPLASISVQARETCAPTVARTPDRSRPHSAVMRGVTLTFVKRCSVGTRILPPSALQGILRRPCRTPGQLIRRVLGAGRRVFCPLASGEC